MTRTTITIKSQSVGSDVCFSAIMT